MFIDSFFDEFILMGLRGPHPVSIAALKARAVQWAYLLYGLRDGQPCPNEKIAWSGWRWLPRGRLPNALLKAERESDLKEVAEGIARWIPPIPGYRDFRNVLKKCGVELGAAKHLWFYPRDSVRPSSDHKRIDFFAKTLAGLMLGVAPATAAKKLSQRKLPKLWITDYDKDGS